MLTTDRRSTAPTSRGFRVATLIGFAVVVAIAARSDRAYRRWWKANHPFAAPRARLERMGADYRNTRANVNEMAGFFADLLDEITRASAGSR